MSKHTDTVLHITPAQYREYAEIAKSHGMVLRLFEQPARIIGLVGGLDPAAIDATSSSEIGSLVEAPFLLLCSSINAGEVRRRGRDRYECDLSKLTDAEMYRFWLFHEIGHKANNYNTLSYQFKHFGKDPLYADTLRRMEYANEVLADRWAWSQVCDRPMPLTPRGQKHQEALAAELAYLDGITGGPRNQPNPWPHVQPGRYHAVPLRMLARSDAALWIGPDVSPAVTLRAQEYEAKVQRNPGHYLPESLLSSDGGSQGCRPVHTFGSLEVEDE